MIKITRLEIEDFGRHKKIHHDLEGHVIGLTGPNGKGKSTVLQAVLTSWDAVLAAPGPLALWAGLLMALSLLGMATLMLGLVVVVPWLAHASWHAYCDLVEPTDTAGAGAN